MTKKEIEKMIRKYSRMREAYNSAEELARQDIPEGDFFKSLADKEFQEIMYVELFIEDTLGIDLFNEYLERNF